MRCGGGGGSASGSYERQRQRRQPRPRAARSLPDQAAQPSTCDPQRDLHRRGHRNSSRAGLPHADDVPDRRDRQGAAKLVADLATDTGTSSDGGKTWKFTLKDGVKWQDGKAITCEDFKYGISRTFATDVITGGPNYGSSSSTPERRQDGTSVYKGPYKKTGQAAFDKAVTCDGNDHHVPPQEAVGRLQLRRRLAAAFAPFRKDKDKGDKSNYAVFSNGPYMLAGHVDQGQGRHVRPQPQLGPEDGHRSARPTRTRSSSVEGLEPTRSSTSG